MSEPLLLHICCAPCLSGCLDPLSDSGWELTGYFYNPNIHPFSEHERRASTLADYSKTIGITVHFSQGYPLAGNLAMMLSAERRCAACFEDRLGSAASKAAELGIGAFATTLSLSPWQDRDLLSAAGRRAAAAAGVDFVDVDLRPFYGRSVEASRAAGLYRQKYCGCIFSEHERLSGTGRRRPVFG